MNDKNLNLEREIKQQTNRLAELKQRLEKVRAQRTFLEERLKQLGFNNIEDARMECKKLTKKRDRHIKKAEKLKEEMSEYDV